MDVCALLGLELYWHEVSCDGLVEESLRLGVELLLPTEVFLVPSHPRRLVMQRGKFLRTVSFGPLLLAYHGSLSRSLDGHHR